MSKVTGRNQISGNWGQLWWNGELVYEIQSFEAKVTPNREDVQIGMDVDSKIISLKGEGTMKVKKVFSRGKKKLLDAWRKGEDPRSKFVYKLSDPDTVGRQVEQGVINNVWFNEMTLSQFEMGQKLEEEYTFGFTPSDADFIETIDVEG